MSAHTRARTHAHAHAHTHTHTQTHTQVTPERNQDAVALDLLGVLATLFSREQVHPDRAKDAAQRERARGVVVQPNLPPACAAALEAHNAAMLRVAQGMARAAARLVPAPEPRLPLSGVSFVAAEGAKGPAALAEAALAASPSVCCPFSQLSGTDANCGLYELLGATRPDIGIRASLIPIVPVTRRCGGRLELAALALDFYTSEALNVVCAEVGISSGVAWQRLRTLQLILVSLSKALAAMAPEGDVVAVSLQYLETKFSEKFFSRLYK